MRCPGRSRDRRASSESEPSHESDRPYPKTCEAVLGKRAQGHPSRAGREAFRAGATRPRRRGGTATGGRREAPDAGEPLASLSRSATGARTAPSTIAASRPASSHLAGARSPAARQQPARPRHRAAWVTGPPGGNAGVAAVREPGPHSSPGRQCWDGS